MLIENGSWIFENSSRPWSIRKLSTIFPIRLKMVYCTNMRNLQITEAEENVLVQMACFFTDLGTPDEFDQDAFDSLFEKITDPSPFDYS